jgi:hypothetical protein
MIAVIITFRKSNKDELDSRAGAARSSSVKHPLREVSTEVREYLLPYGPDCTCRLCSCGAQFILKHKRISRSVQ